MFVFDKDIAIDNVDPEHQSLCCEISSNWSVSDVPNGGYLIAILANAMMQFTDKTQTPILTANYISRCEPGKAEIVVEKFSASNQFDRLQANLIQDGKERIRAFGTFAKTVSGETETRFEKSSPDVVALDECIAIPEFTSGYSIFQQLDVRLDPGCAGWMNGNLTEISEHKGWIKFKDDRPFDIYSVLLLADSFPPPVFVSQGMVAWVPTIEFSVNVRSIPETNWLKPVFRTRFINNGLLEEDGEIWDENDNLIAISRQIAQYKKI